MISCARPRDGAALGGRNRLVALILSVNSGAYSANEGVKLLPCPKKSPAGAGPFQ